MRSKITPLPSARLIVPLCIIFVFIMPCGAKLSSTKTQEANMVARAASVSEKWVRFLNDTLGKNDTCAQEIADLSRKIRGYGDGILSDMGILGDVGRLYFFSRRLNRLFRAINEFDNAVEQLTASDRRRYYIAKAELRSETIAPVQDSIKRDWFSCLQSDCCRATRSGFEADKSMDFIHRFAEKNGLKENVAAEAGCRITVEYARFFLSDAKRERQKHDDKKAFKTAVQGIRAIPALSPLDTALCAKWKSQEDLLSLYDSCFVRPLSLCAGGRADEFRIEVCSRYWQYRKLVASVIVRIRTPSSGAFDIFEKAGSDVILQHDGRIAAAELALWKRAGKGKEFREKFPERYQLARKAAALRR